MGRYSAGLVEEAEALGNSTVSEYLRRAGRPRAIAVVKHVANTFDKGSLKTWKKRKSTPSGPVHLRLIAVIAAMTCWGVIVTSTSSQ
jgi:hypothetical protein